MSWPLSQDYNEAIQSPRSNFTDADLQRGEAVANALGLPMPYSGNFADVYQVRCPDGKSWAVKCFTREAPGLRERYQEISAHLVQAKLPFMVDFSYLDQGMRVAGKWYPVLKMQWVEGLTLNQFVSQYLDKPAMLEALSQMWARMGKYLRAAETAHCDLQHGNVLLVPGANANSLALKLIDYDGMWVPALAKGTSGEVGHPSYQHPRRLSEQSYNIDVDRFPLLLIATALRALKAKGKGLWDKYDNGDNLLFKEPDLREPLKSQLFLDLTKTDDAAVKPLVDHLIKALRGGLETTPLLDEVMPEARPSATTSSRPSRLGPAAAPAVAPVAPVASAALVAAAVLDFDGPAPGLVKRAKGKRTTTKLPGAPMKVWIGVGAAAVVVIGLVGGLAAWAISGPSKQQEQAPAAPKATPPAPMAAESEAVVLLQIDQPGAEVAVDGQSITVDVPGNGNSVRVKVKPGEHNLSVSKDGFRPFAADLALRAGQVSPLRVQLEPIDKPMEPIDKPTLAPVLEKIPPLYQDRFNDPKSGWPRGTDKTVDWGYADGNYRIRRRAPGLWGWNSAYRSPDEFACEVVGRVVGQPGDGWGLSIGTNDKDKFHAIQVVFPGEGKVKAERAVWESDKERGPQIGPVENAAIKAIGEWNTLLVVVRGRRVEVYVNGVAVLRPFTVDRAITPAVFALVAFGPSNDALAEFQRITVWPAAGLPPASSVPDDSPTPAPSLPSASLKNPGFESGTDDWSLAVYGAKPTVVLDPTTTHEGKQSLRISSTNPSDTAFGQDLMLTPGGRYRFHGWVRTRGLDPRGAPVYGTFQIQMPKGKGASASGTNHGGDTDWTEVVIEFAAPPGGRIHAAVFFTGFGKGTGTAWFDDLKIEELDAPKAPAEQGSNPPADAEWLKTVAALPPDQQVRAVAAKLKELNPGFDGKATPTIENGVVTALDFVVDNVTDISPVRALNELRELRCAGSGWSKGRLADLSPLKGMKLTSLNCTSTQVSDLSPLKGMPLTELHCYETRVSDLSPLKSMMLALVDCGYTSVSDLSPLKDMPLANLQCFGTPVSDLSPLKGMKLTSLNCGNMPHMSDLSPLKGMPLKDLNCDFDPKRDAEILRSLKTLKKINGMPAAQFWKGVNVK